MEQYYGLNKDCSYEQKKDQFLFSIYNKSYKMEFCYIYILKNGFDKTTRTI